ncbi:MAG: DUF2585 family protein [Chloracidobacterium sp.]|nr:DUF2585 family protein [Chloracidobacterium sp.]MCC6825699.1 DUF2585 family protein [Acidobacteriota bacterium]MCO5333966.1 DUF2585 family protein [Pyrinomonadaceae bacterium]
MMAETPQRLLGRGPLLACITVIAATALFLNFQGRVWWCQAGDLSPWAWDIWSTHNSQHLLDPYSFTHILHGVFEYWMLLLLFPNLPAKWRLVIAVAIEAAWEALENSSFIINRYRTATLSLDYFGDSIINSISDIVCCGLGFVIASKLRFRRSLLFFIVTEITLTLTIRDSLILNVIMLLYPIDAIKVWQMAGR